MHMSTNEESHIEIAKFVCMWLTIYVTVRIYLTIICDCPSENQHSLHLRFWSFNGS